MKENYNDIEKLIFGGGLASGSIEPSEKFWSRAYEGIIKRDARANANRTSRWRAAFFVMGAAALLLGGYIIYVQNEVSEIKQQLTAIENTRNNKIQQNPSQSTVINKAKNTSRLNLSGSIQQTTNATVMNAVNTKSGDDFTHKNAGKIYNHTTSYATVAPTNTVQVAIMNKETPEIGETTIPVTDVVSSQPTNNHFLSAAIPPNVSTGNDKKAALLSGKISDSAKAVSGLDSTKLVYPPKKPITLKGILSRISVSAFYAPGITDDFLNDKNNDPTNTVTAHELQTQQDGDGTFAAGFRLAYTISGKWAVQTGAYYSQYTYNINPTIIYAQQQENGQIGYSITTSSGTVFLPNSDIPAHFGDSIKVKGSSSRGYIRIPLQAKYTLAAGTKLSFYIDGGFSVNIAHYTETDIHWNNTALQDGDISVQNIYGLNSVQYSYNFGFGAAYLIGKGLSIYTEPFVDGSFTSINKNTPVITYPYFFGLAFGATYHF